MKDGNITEWAIEQVKGDRDNKLAWINEILSAVALYYLETPIAEIREKLRKKMNKGFEEHGPIGIEEEGEEKIDIKAELENEYLDLIGWTMIQKYLAKKAKQDEL